MPVCRQFHWLLRFVPLEGRSTPVSDLKSLHFQVDKPKTLLASRQQLSTRSLRMFNSAMSSSFGSQQHFANAYRQIEVETGVSSASPHQLVLMLYDGLLESVGRARAAMVSGAIELKCAQISRAVRILDEGLIAGLDLEAGEIAKNLSNLYNYATVQLTRSNLRNDLTLLDEVERLIRPLRDAWAAIGAKMSHGAAG